MQYVKLGNTGLTTSRFGLGCMRFTQDEQNAINIARFAIDNGVNYLDTGYFYKNSEEIVGKALQDGYRDRTILVTKCPVGYVEKPTDFEKYLDEQLQRLQTDCIDIYLFHNVDVTNWDKVVKFDGFRFMEDMVKKGKIKHRGCSMHGSYQHFQKVSKAYDWELMTLQMGLLDTENQAGVKGLKELAARNIPVTVMSPLRGGNLLKFAPPRVHELIENFPIKRSLQEWGFRYLYNMPEVSVILSGVTTMEQLQENIEIFQHAQPNVMSSDEMQLLLDIKETFIANYAVPCTNCNYCMPCPAGVNIPEAFNYYNLKQMTNHWTDSVLYKKELMGTNSDASQCIECGACEQQCPQSIEIIKKLKEAHEVLSK